MPNTSSGAHAAGRSAALATVCGMGTRPPSPTGHEDDGQLHTRDVTVSHSGFTDNSLAFQIYFITYILHFNQKEIRRYSQKNQVHGLAQLRSSACLGAPAREITVK